MLGGGLLAEIAIWAFICFGLVSAISNGYLAWVEFKAWKRERRRRKSV